MPKDFQQTDTAAGLGADVACSVTIAGTPFAKDATDGGTAGTTEVLPKNAVSQANRSFCMVEIDPGEDVPSGDHITRWDITTANLNVTLTRVYCCWWNGTVFSELGLTDTINDDLDASVKTVTILSADASPSYSAGDRLYYVFVCTVSVDHGNEQFGWTPSQLMTTPIVEAGPVSIPDLHMAQMQAA